MDLMPLLEKTLTGLGYELVDLESANRGGLLRIFIDKADGINVDDCARVSNHLTRLFAVEGIEFDRLEVSSPGLDRPLKRPADFRRFIGEKATIKVRLPLNGRKKFAGTLSAVGDTGIQIEVEGEAIAIAFADIDKARLIPNI
jgi:ribosome maturation factor RimP